MGDCKQADYDKLEHAGRLILEAIGEDLDREELKETPARFARWWREFIDYHAGNTDTLFVSDGTDQMVVVSGMRVWSVCEHHLLPFWCDVAVAYIPNGTVMGLSKIARIAHKHAHKLQIQEGLVDGIAAEIAELTGVESVAVVAKGKHLCMLMRGIKTDGLMTSSSLKGAFREDPSARQEFFSHIKD